MAIQSVGGKFVPSINYHNTSPNREREPETRNGKTTYTRDCRFRKENASDLIKWCRRNFGERGNGWDFTFVSEFITIEVWFEKYKVMYEMWKL